MTKITDPNKIAKMIDRVEITSKMDEIGCGRGNMDRKTVLCHTVHLYWNGVDRPHTSSWSCAANRKLAERLKAAMESGKAFKSAEIVKDVNGKTYVNGDLAVFMRYANSDLKKLGF